MTKKQEPLKLKELTPGQKILAGTAAVIFLLGMLVTIFYSIGS